MAPRFLFWWETVVFVRRIIFALRIFMIFLLERFAELQIVAGTACVTAEKCIEKGTDDLSTDVLYTDRECSRRLPFRA